ncbi:AbrB/MazE/SpoVT family DNA-binding domain-containing protein [Verminephrobacter aporrectodeae subsp. tuberculatae]|nr:AbrB/MazE/SpoVT family DNA-binding domain-containing protein [Verminephrobacter aporrectodeae subsp. tuberculatae]MCW8169705.1 AbrB/MazE/SpoVT family DNA-binding domain-containing protein [Verminephrobacter aporrectodeae subsp. tuberculatae]
MNRIGPERHQKFITRQFMAGNSPAVRIPISMAFPDKTELMIIRDGDRIIVEPKEKMLGDVPRIFQALGKYFVGGRPEFEEIERNW